VQDRRSTLSTDLISCYCGWDSATQTLLIC